MPRFSAIPSLPTLVAVAVASLVPGLAGATPGAPLGPAPETRTAPVPASDPLQLTPAMKEFLEQGVDRRKTKMGRLHDLMDALFDPENGLGVQYGTSGTRTAAETFAAAEGNCLSFTLLFVALAREVGLRAHFVEVAEVVGWSRRGPTTFGHWHIYAEIEADNGLVLVDFLPVEERRYFQRRRIDERRVRAHFHNNLGAEALADGRAEEALGHLRRALDLDPTFVPASVNLAVAHRRAGRPEQAEELLRKVLADDPRNSQAATNLASLLDLQGRSVEAESLRDRAQDYLRRNPFHHFELAMTAMDSGDLETARQRLEAAIRRRPGEVLFHERMGEILARLGQTGSAVESLEKALRLAKEPETRERIDVRLRELRPPRP